MTSLSLDLSKIQKELKAPKSQFNNFGKYNYRNCEDILEAVKPLLGENLIVVSDEMVEVGGRVYVKATASFTDGELSVVATAYAREAETKKGMDDAQITGSASSYARKYALNGLLLIDDAKDADFAAETKKPVINPDRLIKHNEAVRDNLESICAIKVALRMEKWDTAAEGMRELSDEVRGAIGIASTKGGIFDLDDTAAFKTTEYEEAKKRYFEDKKCT